jgi:hypothetical protein
MRTIIIDVPKSGVSISLALASGRTSGQVVLVLGEDVELVPTSVTDIGSSPTQARPFEEFQSKTGFPPRRLTEQTIVQILREHGGVVKIRDTDSGWNIYDEIAARIGVTVEARRRLTEGTGEPAWRPEVGFCRKNLEQGGKLQPTEVSGRGVWALKI